MPIECETRPISISVSTSGLRARTIAKVESPQCAVVSAYDAPPTATSFVSVISRAHYVTVYQFLGNSQDIETASKKHGYGSAPRMSTEFA